MINIDDRLFKSIDADEFWLMCQIVKRFDKINSCWPSNKTLCEDTRWSLKKLQAVKVRLLEKGLLLSRPRYRAEKQSSNEYQITTGYISVFVKVGDIPAKFEGESKLPTQSELPTPPESKGSNEVLTTEVLTRTDESKDSSFQNNLFEGTTRSKKKKERVREADECYSDFVKVWTEEYKILGFGAVDGKCIKEIIRLTKAHISGKDKLPTLETTVNMFKYVIAYVKRERHFCDGKPLTTWKSQYLSIIHEIANGKPKQATYTDRIRSTNDIIRGL